MHHADRPTQPNLVGCVPSKSHPAHPRKSVIRSLAAKPPAIKHPIDRSGASPRTVISPDARRSNLGFKTQRRATLTQRLDQGRQQRARSISPSDARYSPSPKRPSNSGSNSRTLLSPQPLQVALRSQRARSVRPDDAFPSGRGNARPPASLRSSYGQVLPSVGTMPLPQRQPGGNAPARHLGFGLAQLAVRRQHTRPNMAAMMVEALRRPVRRG
jgi:hypothetical protein